MTTQPSLTPAAFAAKWRGVTTTEKASAQEHFTGLSPIVKLVTLDDLAADDPSDALARLRASSCDH